MKVEIDVAESGQSRKVSLSVSAAALSSLDELREDWLPLPDVLGQGQFQVTQLSNGASLTISECNLTREYRSRVEHDAPFVGIVFCMDGEVSLELSGLAEAQSLVAGEFALFGAFGTSLTRTSPGEQADAHGGREDSGGGIQAPYRKHGGGIILGSDCRFPGGRRELCDQAQDAGRYGAVPRVALHMPVHRCLQALISGRQVSGAAVAGPGADPQAEPARGEGRRCQRA